ncbi:MAG: hypothetical protein OXI67_01980 [Candidatus Poribacteria bacterium]|nr:hypothetical protein [Candidatus Poribacteria bacterium]
MEHTTRIELENLKDLHLAEADVIKPEDVRKLTIEDALVDTVQPDSASPNRSFSNSDLPRSDKFGCKPQMAL